MKENSVFQLVIGESVRISAPDENFLLLVEYCDEDGDWQQAGHVSTAAMIQLLQVRKN